MDKAADTLIIQVDNYFAVALALGGNVIRDTAMLSAKESHDDNGWIKPVAIKKAGWVLDRYGADMSARLNYVPGSHIMPIVKQLGGKVEHVDFIDLDRSELGSIEIKAARDFKIILPNFFPLEQLRFTIAHELGHYLVHYATQPLPRRGMRAARHGRGLVESEANWFASGFLMPKEAFLAEMRKMDSKIDVAWLAARFWVSYRAADIRVKNLRPLLTLK